MNKLIFILFLFAYQSSAAIIYVDPINGSINGNGSFDNPYPRVQYLINNKLIESREPASKPYDWNDPLKTLNPGALVQPGDTIMCFSGYQGALDIVNFYNEKYITIMPVEGHRVMFRNVFIRASAGWRVSGVEVSPSFHPQFNQIRNIVNLESHSFAGPISDIEISNCRIFTVEDIYSWTADDWLNNVGSGISASYYCRRFRILNNEIKNVDFGIAIATDRAMVQGNTITNFSGDAMRGNGSNMTFDHNVIKNNYNVDENHDDAFQGFNFAETDTFRNVKLTNNLVIQNADSLQPLNLRGNLQGLAFFDGNIKNWYVANNIVIVDHYHGISLYGCHECQVVNNTVIDLRPGNKPKPWILVRSKKAGDPIQGTIIANNIATKILAQDDPNPIVRNNMLLEGPAYRSNFKNPRGFDFHLLPSSRAIDNALQKYAPNNDFYDNARPFGSGSDIGAVECIEACKSTSNDLGVDKNTFFVYPNPVYSNLNISHDLTNAEITIFNQLGQVVISSNAQLENSIDVSFLMDGIYSIMLSSDRKIQVGQFVKK